MVKVPATYEGTTSQSEEAKKNEKLNTPPEDERYEPVGMHIPRVDNMYQPVPYESPDKAINDLIAELERADDYDEDELEGPRMGYGDLACSSFSQQIRFYNKNIAFIEGLDDCTQLKHLSLKGNDIRRIEGLDSCTHLITVELDGNRIRHIEGLD